MNIFCFVVQGIPVAFLVTDLRTPYCYSYFLNSLRDATDYEWLPLYMMADFEQAIHIGKLTKHCMEGKKKKKKKKTLRNLPHKTVQPTILIDFFNTSRHKASFLRSHSIKKVLVPFPPSYKKALKEQREKRQV